MSTSKERPADRVTEEDDDEVLGDDDDGELEEMMEGDPFANYLVNEEGDNIADIMSSAVKQMEMQNKILIKILTVLSKTDSTSRKA
jgi:hypothetical protein